MMAKKIVMVQVLLALVSSVFSADPTPMPTTLAYRLELKIDYGTKKVYGRCGITISNETEQAMEKVPVLLYRLLSVNQVEGGQGGSLPFSQNVVSISGWEQIQVNFIEVSLGDMLLPGEQATLELDYEGWLFGYSADGWRYVKDHIDKSFTLVRTDGWGYPVIGYPNERDMMRAWELFDYEVQVTVPEGLTVATAGVLTARTQTGDETTFVFHSKAPSFRLDIAISDYHIFESGLNKVIYFPSDSLGAQKVMNALQSSFDLYSDWFGPLEQYQGFSVLEVPEGYGSQTDITAIILSADNFNESRPMNTIYHEMAHAWNVRNLEAQPCRIESEGYARFLEYLLMEKIDRRENMVSETAQRFLDRIRTSFNENTEYLEIPVIDYGTRDMTNYSYTLGMVIFTIFYDLVGQDPFNEIIGSYYAKYHATGATVEDFIAHCQKSSPLDLENFFNDWIYTTRGIHLIADGKSLDELIRLYAF
jgi:aminopeptidase N